MSEPIAFDWRFYRVVTIGFLAIKLALLVFARPFMDETYYWLWGQHLALSYFDHPPLVGWTQALAAAIFGWNIAGLRAFVFLTIVGDLVLLYGFARHLAGAAWRDLFWPSAALFAATPIFFGLSNLALPDHLLIFFSLLSLYGFARFRTAYAAGLPRWRFLYLAAAALGFATLSKYTGALLAVGFFTAILVSRPLRSVLRSPHFYLAALLALLMQAPVFLWNLQHDLASFGFITGGRRPLANPSNLGGLIGYVLGILLVLSPFLVWPLLRFASARRDPDTLTARLVFWLSTLVFLVASLFTNILIHWNAVAYIAALPHLASHLRSRILVVGHFVFGLLLAGMLVVNTTMLPALALLNAPDQTSSWNFGWDKIATEVRAIADTRGSEFIAATDYALASPLAFALEDPGVASLSPRREAFDDWFDPEAHAGQSAILVADRWRPLTDAIRARFESVEEAKTLTIERFGRPLDTYTIYIARAYTP